MARPDDVHLDLVRRMALLAEHRDPLAAAHIERIGRFCEVMGRGLRFTPERATLFRHASQLHDVGKVALPDAIAFKHGTLSGDELHIMQQHTRLGAEILRGSESPVLQLGEIICLTHHERWDGSGYPEGLQGAAIPIESRIVGLLDVFDALRTERPYRAPLSVEWVDKMLESKMAHEFDPEVLHVFFEHRDQIEAIHQRHGGGGA
jgi:putative two-component system response regulator